MVKILPLIEGFVLANITTQNLFDTNPLTFLLGDLNANAPMDANMLQLAMGPSSTDAITLKEILTNSMNVNVTRYRQATPGGKTQSYQTRAQVGGVLAEVQDNFMNNMGNIIVGTVASTAGFRVAKKVLRKPIAMANKTLRNAGLGSTVQF